MNITQELLKEYLQYDPISGDFVWLKTRGNRTDLVGKRAGTLSGIKKDRLYIRLFGKRYILARLAYLYMCGEWPKHDIDHIDRNPLNNSWNNLRDATRSQNCANRLSVRKKFRLSKGVTVNGSKYEAAIKVNKKRIYLGLFSTQEEAAEAYKIASKKFYGEYSCP